MFLLFLSPLFSKAQWIDYKFPFSDNLISLANQGNYMVAIGDEGLYYNLDVEDSTQIWKKFVANKSSVQILMESCLFKDVSRDFKSSSSGFWLCGQVKNTKNAILFYIDPSTRDATSVYIGKTPSSLNAVNRPMPGTSTINAVGDNGLIVEVVQNVGREIENNITDNLIDISSDGDESFFISAKTTFKATVVQGQLIYDHRKNYSNALAVYPQGFKSSKKAFVIGQSINFFDNVMYRATIDRIRLNGALAQCAGYTGIMYIGTSKGIYRSYDNNTTFEYQPSSKLKNIRAITHTSKRIYACGPDGTFLVTNNNGGASEPQAYSPGPGSCKGASFYLTCVALAGNTL